MHGLLKKLGEIPSFTAAQIAKKGWTGIRTREAAQHELEALVASGDLRKLPANRKGQPKYALAGACVVEPQGDDSQLAPVYWASWGSGGLVPPNESGELDGYSVEFIPNDDDAAEIFRLERVLGGGTFKNVAARIREHAGGNLSNKAIAWALVIAQERINPNFAPLPAGRPTGWSVPQSNDPIATDLRGIARHLGIRSATLSKAVRAAEAERRAAIREPTMSV